jgi:DNA sulfur modification protein DndD
MTYDVSEGQKHIIALSFITALASLAVVEKDNKIFPLFIDTPFARLDSEKRGALIKTLPNLTNQLILLLTDTELRDEEKLKFKATKKIGKWYELKQLNEDCTIIQEKSF